MWFRYSERKMVELFANSRDPDQTPCSVSSDQGLHCLPITLLGVSRLQWVNVLFCLPILTELLKVLWTPCKKVNSCLIRTILEFKGYAQCFFWLSWGLMTRQPLWVILCCLPEKERHEIVEIAEEMKETDREERKMNESEETEEIKHFPLPLPATRIACLAQL